MFDLGFGLQINRSVQNIRSDHQTVLFSAIFPHQVKVLAGKVLNRPVSAAQMLPNGGLPVSFPGVLGGVTLRGTSAVVPGMSLALVGHEGAARAAAIAAAMNLLHNLAKNQPDAMPKHFEAKLEINDIPQNALWKVTHKETLGPISELTGAAITIRGQYFPPGKVPGPGDPRCSCLLRVLLNNLSRE